MDMVGFFPCVFDGFIKVISGLCLVFFLLDSDTHLLHILVFVVFVHRDVATGRTFVEDRCIAISLPSSSHDALH